ncbi:MAG TPA: ATP-binding cassette domain-containing protein [Thermoanaerobaculia bacterium]|nr:ATP-binding cassette domain-containing protein [Thermoanaerobaculia bacterium]
MLDVALEAVSLDERLRGITITFAKSTHTALIGPPGSGASTLLRVIAGEIRPTAGEIRIGTRNVTNLAMRRRPLLFVGSEIDAPLRWSVRHLLVAAVRQRTLDRTDRHHEYELAIAKWKLGSLIDRPLRTLATSELTLAHLAHIELMRPGIVVADRILERLNPASLAETADEFFRTLRVMGATVISAPSSNAELGLTDRVVVLDRGTVVQEGALAAVYRRPNSIASAVATGDVNVIPVRVRAGEVESAIGNWSAKPPFQGEGVALARPEDFAIAAAGEESDLIFGIEEASFRGGRWIATGLLTGGLALRVGLPPDLPVHKGRLLPLKYDSSRFVLLPH